MTQFSMTISGSAIIKFSLSIFGSRVSWFSLPIACVSLNSVLADDFKVNGDISVLDDSMRQL